MAKATETSPPPSLDVELLALGANQCHWPFGDRGSYRFCGHPVQPGEVYCPHHHRRSISPKAEMHLDPP